MGTVRRRYTAGTWVFKRETWESEDFDAVINGGAEPVEVSEGIFIQCVSTQLGWVLQGTVQGVACIFGEVDFSNPKGFSFQMMSVPGIELQAKTHVIPGTPTRARVV
jgi:hypothetical protein